MEFVYKKTSSKKWLVWLVAMMITLSAISGILTLHRWSSASRRAVELLSDVEGQASRLNALEWEAMARKGVNSELKSAYHLTGKRVDRMIDELSQYVNANDLSAIRIAYREYVQAIGEEYGFLEVKQFALALEVDDAKVDPAYDELVDVIGEAQLRYAASSRGTIFAVDVSSTAVLLLAALSIGLLFSKFEQVQRLKEVLVAEQNALRQSEERFRALVQNTSDMIAILNPLPPTIKFMSDSIHRVLGHRPESLLGTDISKLIHPDDGGKMQRFLANCAFNPRSTYLAEVRLRHSNGSWSQVEMFGDNRVDDTAIGGIVINFRDVAEPKSIGEVFDPQQTDFEFPERKLH
jgi:PAS domain S-box-containing protein